jgi:PAS domain S-box-containing protein
MLRAMCEDLDWDVGALWLLNESQQLLATEVWCSDALDAAPFIEATKARTFEPGVGLPGRVLSTRKPHWISRLESDTNFPRSAFAAQAGLRSGFGFPIQLGRRVLGVIEVFSREHRSQDRDLLNAMASLGRQIGQLVERSRAETELKRRVREQAVVADLGQRALEGIELQALMDETALRVSTTLGVDYTKILELLPDGQSLLLRAGVGWTPGTVGNVTVSAGKGSQSGYTLLSSEPVIVEDLRTETRFDAAPLLIDHDVVSGMSVIIHGRHRPFGALGVHARTARRFTSDDINFIQSVANVLATAIERKQAEQELRRSKEELADFLENAVFGMHWMDKDGIILWANRAELNMLGYTAEEYVGRKISDFHADSAVIDDILTRLTRGEELHQIPARMHCKDGSTKDVLIDSNALFENGELLHTRCFTLDITQRKLAEEALIESEQRFKSLFDYNVDAVFSFDLDGAFTSANPACQRVSGYSTEELLGTSFAPLVVEEDLQRAFDSFTRAVLGEPQTIEVAIRHKEGHRVDLSVTAIPIITASGTTGVFGIAKDISERKRAEQGLRESERRYRELIEGVGVAVYTTDAEGRITLYNEAAAELWGRHPELGKDLWCGSWKLYWPDGSPMQHDQCPLAITLKENRPVRDAEAIAERPDGTRVSFVPYPMPLRDASGAITGAVNVLVDITDRKRAEQALRESEERLRMAMDASRMGAWEWNMDTNEVRWSAGLETIHGIEPGTFAGTFEAFLKDVHPDDRDRLSQELETSVRRGVHDVEYRIVLPNGTIRWVAGKGRVEFQDGQPKRMIGVCLDVTERKAVEDQLRQANEAKDEFLGLVSHELRTPITTIYGGARLLRSRDDILDAGSRTEILMDIEHESERLHRIVEDLLVLSRLELEQRVETEPVLVQHIIRKVADASVQKKPERAIEVSISQPLGPVAGDPTYLEQVLRNLLSNADKYSPIDAPVEIHARQNGANEVVVSVLDHGPAVSSDEIDRIFDRFYRSKHSTKQVGGAGIGLTVCKRLIEAQSGRIWATLREGGGLEVCFALPMFLEDGG